MDDAGQASTDGFNTQPDALKEKLMNAKLQQFAYPVIVALSLGAAFAAHAEATPDDYAKQVWSQTKSRAQVRAELDAARADGTLDTHSYSYNPWAKTQGQLTREEVRAQLRVDRELHGATTLMVEGSGYPAEVAPVVARSAGSQVVANKAR
jgi:hypothetical protein